MTRWLLAMVFAFGSVTVLTGCPSEEESAGDKIEEGAEDVKEGAEDIGDEIKEGAEDIAE